jgi:transposase-like protein
MARYSPVFKKELLEKILGRRGKSLEQSIRESGISRATVFRWIKEYIADPHGIEMKAARPQDWSIAAKTKALLETRFMTEAELGVYLRSKGLYHCHLKEWKEDVVSVMGRNRKITKLKNDSEDALLRQRVKDLTRELKLKDKALKEATALLALKKKAELIWGVREEEKSPPTTEEDALKSSKKPKKTAVD